ncbi:NUDIX hydrolase [Paracoccus sediminicola]|uniref:NUDIX hydrolase n=1 Tax=Paracoccus sediminicola TaxID=3017783 RepID=UPI0022F0160A|nr:CoA pyrophosphatase [Paracoccus sediminicola]WBU56720.1 CoA pyrophosphatase [Paracoccus sediminicola]
MTARAGQGPATSRGPRNAAVPLPSARKGSAPRSGDDLRSALTAALERQTPPSSDFDFDDRPMPPDATLREAGVLAAFHETDGRLYLTKRAATMRHHPGQVALPGGKLDPGDADVVAAALREAQEEIGLDSAQLEILGTLPTHRTVTQFRITPVIGIVRGDFEPIAEPGEVAEVFALPFSHISDPGRYRLEGRMWRGEWRAYRVAPFGPYYLWGATARILHGLAERLRA